MNLTGGSFAVTYVCTLALIILKGIYILSFLLFHFLHYFESNAGMGLLLEFQLVLTVLPTNVAGSRQFLL